MATQISTSLGSIVRRILPEGSRSTGRTASWKLCPTWPRDVFAVVASLVLASSCHQEPGLILHENDFQRDAKRKYVERAKEMGSHWDDPGRVPRGVQQDWDVLVQNWDAQIDTGHGIGTDWKWAALRLLIASDYACSGIGYAPAPQSGIAKFVWSELVEDVAKKTSLT